MKAEGEGMFSITTSEKITVGVTKKKKNHKFLWQEYWGQSILCN